VLKRQIPVDIAAFIISRVARGLATPTRNATSRAATSTSSTATSAQKNVLIAYEGDVKA